ncbi:TetR/AcrR family transcriptional regulator [Mycobacterium mantenii]|nr:TetR/AcrR family transcriptional regulator [Mycobacterium mantenii]MCV7246161.1 TetR/AcrR family transcriptional regulator [Mycobacterium mantenii]
MSKHTSVVRRRRRGEVLEHALYEATLAELAAVGFGALTIEGIASRANTGKAALYRRWPTKRALVLAALRQAQPQLPQLRANYLARANLLKVLSAYCDVLAGETRFPGLFVAIQTMHEPELRAMFIDAVVGPLLTVIESILRDVQARGEIDATTDVALAARIGPALILQHALLTGAPPKGVELTRIVHVLTGGR